MPCQHIPSVYQTIHLTLCIIKLVICFSLKTRSILFISSHFIQSLYELVKNKPELEKSPEIFMDGSTGALWLPDNIHHGHSMSGDERYIVT